MRLEAAGELAMLEHLLCEHAARCGVCISSDWYVGAVNLRRHSGPFCERGKSLYEALRRSEKRAYAWGSLS